MQAYNITSARKHFSQIVNSQEIVEVTHPKNPVMIVPKAIYEKMEREMLMREMDEALERAKGQKRYTTEQVEAMIVEIAGEEFFNG